MKTSTIWKRLLSLLLLSAMVLGLVPSALMPTAQAAESWDVDGDGTLSFLAIGNSFSTDALEYVWQIANSLGISKIVLGNLYIGGCTLATHASNAAGDTAAYTYYFNNNGTWTNTKNYKMSTALSSRSWDYVSMQQASPNSGQANTYDGNLTNLITYVKGKAPNAKLVWHMTWAYQGDSTHSGFANYNKNQTTMYSNIVSAVQSKILTNSNFAMVIPNGTAIQNVRSSLIGDVITRDGYHLNKYFGRYAAGLMVVKQITGLDVSKTTYKPANVPNVWKDIAVEAVNNAYNTPYSVTKSTHTDVTKDSGYTTMKLQLIGSAYWHSASSSYSSLKTNESNSPKYYATNPRFQKSDLPTGCVITVASGWQYRPDAWRTNAKQSSSDRPDVTTKGKDVVTDEWWMYDKTNEKSYVYRAFNISKTDGSSLAKVTAATVNANFKIYIPKEYVSQNITADSILNKLADSTYKAPVPNNKLFNVTNANHRTMYSKFIFVSDPKNSWSSSSKYYALDPTTPRLFRTFHASPVTITSDNRVMGADPSWALEVRFREAITTSTTSSWGVHYFYVKIPINNLDSSKKYIGLTKQENGLELYEGTSNAAYKRPVLFANYDGDRFHICLDNTRVDNNLTTVRTNFVDPGSDDPYFTTTAGKSVANTPVAGNYVAFKLYQIIDTMVNVEPLYAEIERARAFLSVDPTYSPGYQNYLNALNAAIDNYIYYNGKTNSSADVAKAAQTTIDSNLSALTSAVNNLNAANQVSSLAIPYTLQINVTDALCNNGGLEGTYFISREYEGNIDVVYSLMNPNDISGGDLGISRVDIANGVVKVNDLSLATTLRFVKGSGNGYTLQEEQKSFLTLSGNNIQKGNPYQFKLKKSATTFLGKSGVSIVDSSSTDFLLYCDAASKNAYDWSMEKTQDSGDYRRRTNFILYKCSPATLELYRTLKYILPYLDANQAVKRYPNELYQEFLTYVRSCINDYNKYNTKDYHSNATMKQDLENKANTLREWMTKLTEADSTLSHIDIPVEFLDFRADGLLFEYISSDFNGTSRYALNANVSNSANLTMPGGNATGGNQYRYGLTEDYLINDQMIYKQATVEYLAQLILEDTENLTTFLNALNSTTGGNYNKDFRAKITTIRSNTTANKGSFTDTLEKTDSKANGGTLPWTAVSTAHDLAYYALNNLWRPVDSTDLLSDNKTYNVSVPQRDIMRLYKESNQSLYTLDSKNNVSNDGYYLFNTVPNIALHDIPVSPKFVPMNGLGFESGGAESDLGTYYHDSVGYPERDLTANFHYTMHAYGSFVYYADQNLRFEFEGDDDVYFYINDRLVLDLGGAHSPVTGSVDLNSTIKSLNLDIKEGDVCSFDMFYAERHTTGSNMKFSTNIKIVDTNTLTTKSQYLDSVGTESMVDPNTGIGFPLSENPLLNIGDTVAYGFNLMNQRNVPLYNLNFTDISLGCYLSPEGITLCDPDLVNGAENNISDIRVIYQTVKDGTLDSSTFGDETYYKVLYSDLYTMIENAKAEKTSLPQGTYHFTPTTEEELQNLLAIGIPMDCQISIYGVKRKTIEGDRPYINTLDTKCYYLPEDANATAADSREITGTASRLLQVPDSSSFILPTATKELQVLDYGKPINIPLSNLKDRISVGNTGNVQIGDFVGLTTTGYHSSPLRRLPDDLGAIPGVNLEDATYAYQVDNGAFTVTGSELIFTPDVFMEDIDTVYAIYVMDGCHGMLADGSSVTYGYIQVELTILPATSVYYETDFNPELFNFTQVKDGVPQESAWIKTEENPQSADPYQDYVPDGTASLPTYGNDSNYNNDSHLSNGSSYFVEGLGVKLSDKTTSYTEASFTFTGTGFDLISRTGKNQATIRVQVDRILPDGLESVKKLTVNNKGELELYQIPVVSVNDLPYGDYKVTLWVNEAMTYTGILEPMSRGGEFFFDALRIYDPILTDSTDTELSDNQKLALATYEKQGEAYPYVKELRDLLLSKQDFDSLVEETQGVLFLDTSNYVAPTEATESSESTDLTETSEPQETEPELGATNHLSLNVATYEKLGPKNEIYLSPGQRIAMEVTVTSPRLPVSVDIGAKTIAGDSGTLVAGFMIENPETKEIVAASDGIRHTLESATAQYFALDHTALASRKVWLVISNESDKGDKAENHVISITDIKVAFDGDPNVAAEEARNIKKASVHAEPPVVFTVDGNAKKAAEAFLVSEAETPVHKTDVAIMHSLNLASDIAINYIVSKEALEDYSNATLEVTLPQFEGNTLVGTKTLTLSPVDKGEYLYFILEGLTAVNMADEIEAVLTMEKNGKVYVSEADMYSIARYAYAQLNKASVSASFKTLCANLLRYGGTAQIFKGYRTDALADSSMTQEQLSYLTDPDTVVFGNTNSVGSELSDPVIVWEGKSLDLSTKVGLNFIFSVKDPTVSVEDLSLRITYTNSNGEESSATITGATVYNAAQGYYTFYFSDLLAAELRSVLTVQVYEGDTPLSCTMTYSADTYGANKTGALAELCKALFAYSDSAKAFFALSK